MIGKLFRFSLFGESHGSGVGVIIYGCPPGILVNYNELMNELRKRMIEDRALKSGRLEEDKVKILSGVFKGYTTGAPISIFIPNKDVNSEFYEKIRYTPRPSHADYVAYVKYKGFNDYRGGGMFSGRLTAPIVAAGYFAKKILRQYNISIYAHVTRIGDVSVNKSITLDMIKNNVYKNPVRCADLETAQKMLSYVRSIRSGGDSVGGIVEVIALNVPVGLGEPPLDPLDGDIAKSVMIIPGVKGIEFGDGFILAYGKGSEVNDPFIIRKGKILTKTNRSGGINGGISNGMPIVFRVAFRPPPSIYLQQKTVDVKKRCEVTLKMKGRFDTCIAPKALPILEAITSIILVDHLLRFLAYSNGPNKHNQNFFREVGDIGK